MTRLDTDGACFEVIVVDDGGPQSVEPVVAEFRRELQVRLLVQRRSGPGAARNAGAALARGRYLAFIDDDCTPARTWLTVLAREFARDGRCLIGGRVENALPQNPYSEASEQIGRFVYDYNRSDAAHEPFFTSNNIALSAELFSALDGFTTSIPSATAEDKEFCDRWRARGLELSHVDEAVVYHANDLTLGRFLRQHFNYGRGILSFRLQRRTRIRREIVPEPLKFYLNLVFSPLGGRKAPRRWRTVALLIVSQLATMAGAVRELVRWRRPARERSARERAA
jgi:glycosyltransferase involved in cell wall biosynthesis